MVAAHTPERMLKLTGMRLFGFGAELLPFLSRREAGALRLVCTHFHVAVDQRVWSVGLNDLAAKVAFQLVLFASQPCC